MDTQFYIPLTQFTNGCYKNFLTIPCRMSGGTLSVPDIPDLGMVRDGTKCADEKVITLKQFQCNMHLIKVKYMEY